MTAEARRNGSSSGDESGGMTPRNVSSMEGAVLLPHGADLQLAMGKEQTETFDKLKSTVYELLKSDANSNSSASASASAAAAAAAVTTPTATATATTTTTTTTTASAKPDKRKTGASGPGAYATVVGSPSDQQKTVSTASTTGGVVTAD